MQYNLNKLNLKIIAPISVAILLGTIWILSGKNSTEETRLTNNYQVKQIIWHNELFNGKGLGPYL
jgi:hypothetical protein